MIRIGILSDTHAYLNPKVFRYFADVDEIWHAGDLGSLEILDALKAFKPLRAVHGNIDNALIRAEVPGALRFLCEDVDVFMTHIGGYPGRYEPRVRNLLYASPPKLFVCGHSHILRILFDRSLGMLCLNPGAAGQYGQQPVPTLVRLVIDGADIRDVEVIELRHS